MSLSDFGEFPFRFWGILFPISGIFIIRYTILRVLAEHALHLRSVERICEVFEISIRTFYRWQKLFNEHRAEWQGLLAAMESSIREAVLVLVRKEPFSSFAAAFFRQTGFSLLQSHANPVRSRRRSATLPPVFP